jgi:hypothetical protein
MRANDLASPKKLRPPFAVASVMLNRVTQNREDVSVGHLICLPLSAADRDEENVTGFRP